MQDTAGEAGTSSLGIFSYGPPHMAEQKQDDQLEPTHSISVRIRDVRGAYDTSPDFFSYGHIYWWYTHETSK